jgi:ribosomal protein S18 acetylase RimI-like enzyme
MRAFRRRGRPTQGTGIASAAVRYIHYQSNKPRSVNRRSLVLGIHPMNIDIVVSSAADAEEILALQKLAYQYEADLYQDDSIPPLKQTLKEMKGDYDTNIILKAIAENKIIGSVRAYLKEGTCCIGRLIVHPDCQNRGLGSRLMNAVEDAFPQASRFELFTGHKSERNLYLYQKLGYQIFKTVPVNDSLKLVFLQKNP